MSVCSQTGVWEQETIPETEFQMSVCSQTGVWEQEKALPLGEGKNLSRDLIST